MVDQIQTNDGMCVTKDGVVPSGTDADCCCVAADLGCRGCVTSPTQIQITLAATSGGCNCAGFGGTYVLDFLEYRGSPTDICFYRYTWPTPVEMCNGFLTNYACDITAAIYNSVDLLINIRLESTAGACPGSASPWAAQSTTSVIVDGACDDVTGEVLTWNSAANYVCNGGVFPTATWTSIP